MGARKKKGSSSDTAPVPSDTDGGGAAPDAVSKLPGSKADLKTKADPINHKNVNTVGLETVTGKAGDTAKKNIKRKGGGGGGGGRKPGRDALDDYSEEQGGELDENDPNFDDERFDPVDEPPAPPAPKKDAGADPAGFEVELLEPKPPADGEPAAAADVPPPPPRFAKAGDYVTVHYVGRFVEGSKAVFESTRVLNRKPASFELGAHPTATHLPGWERALLRVPLGRVARVKLPGALAFGALGRGFNGQPGFVPPDTAVEHEVELLAINGEYAKPKVESPRAVAAEGVQRALDSFALDEPAPKKKPAGGSSGKGKKKKGGK